MQRSFQHIAGGLLALVFTGLAALALPAAVQPAAAASPNSDSGVVCTTGAAGNPTFSLTTQTGYISMPDGNSVFMWGLSAGANSFQSPAPVLCVNQGDSVTVVLHNTLAEETSLIFPGQTGVLADGHPSQPVFSGNALTSLTKTAANGGNVTYSFVADHPGTFIYESGTNPQKQVQMGLFGALIVRPAGASAGTHAYNAANPQNYAYNADRSAYSTANEYLMLFSEIDAAIHSAVELGQSYDPTSYAPSYWMINGRSFPDTIAPNGASWLPTQPYSALVHIKSYTNGQSGDRALIRFLNVGTLTHPFHPHGADTHVIARDGYVLQGAGGQDTTYDKFSINIGAGQTWDATYRFLDAEHWNPSSNPLPVALPQPQNLNYKDSATWYSGSPYLGFKSALPNGVISYNQCGEYYHVWHSHALNEATNYGVGFGGMFTLVRIDPSTANSGC